MKIFADRLREKQVSLGISQLKLAKLISVAPGTLSSYLKGEKCPTLEKAVEIAEALGVSVGWLCGEAPISRETISTYADWMEAADALRALLPEGVSEYSSIDGEKVVWVTRDPRIVKHLAACQRVRDQYEKGAIDRDVYETWVEKQLRELAKFPIE